MHIAVPFKIDHVFGGLGEAHGILSFDGEQLLMEFQTKDAVFGILKAPIRNIPIELDSLSSVQIRKGVFRSSLVLRLNDFRQASMIPTAESGEVRILVAKKHYATLQALEAEVNSVKTNRSLDQLMAECQEILSGNSSIPEAPRPPPPPPT